MNKQYRTTNDKILLVLNTFSPFGNVPLLFIGSIAGIYIESKNFSFDTICLILKYYTIYLLLFYLIRYIFSKYMAQINNMEKKIEEKDIELKKRKNNIEELNKKISYLTSISNSNEYTSYSESSHYKELLNTLMNNFHYIESIQVYDYSLSFVGQDSVIRINHFLGEEYDDIDITVNKQKVYKIRNDIFTEACSLCAESLLIKNEEDEEILIQKALEFLLTLSKEINSAKPTDKKDLIGYRKILIIINEIICSLDKSYIEKEDFSIVDDIDIIDILTVIVYGNKDIHHTITFKDKLYLSFLDFMPDENRVIVATIRTDVLPRHLSEKDLCREITKKYDSLIKNEL